MRSNCCRPADDRRTSPNRASASIQAGENHSLANTSNLRYVGDARTVHDIRPLEPGAAVFWEDDEMSETLALLPEFPRVPRLKPGRQQRSPACPARKTSL